MKQLQRFLIPVYLLLSIQLTSQAANEIIGARASAMGNTSVGSTDFWSIQNNQAGMALQNYLSAGIYYQNRFLLNELSTKSGAIVAPTKFGVLGLSFNQFGYNLYNENKFGLAYARAFSDRLRIGIQLDYQSTNVAEGYTSASFVTFELGIQSNITEKLCVGAYIYNPIRMEITAYPGDLAPMIMRLGLAYQFTTEFRGMVDVEKDFETNASVRLGLEYVIQHKFFIRTGLSTNPGLFSMGVGIQLGRLQFDIAASTHQTLGISSQIGLTFQLVKSQANEK